MDNEENNSINNCDIDETEREEYEMAEVRYERIGTVYDECKPDWREFVRQQTEFFRNAEDYISDLRYDLDQVDREIENIFENSDFILMLNQAAGDRQILAKQLNISPYQLSYVTNSGDGEGLLFYGSTIIPFKDKIDKSLKLYSLMTTKPEEVEAR